MPPGTSQPLEKTISKTCCNSGSCQGALTCFDGHIGYDANYICEIPTHRCSAVVPKRKEHDFWGYEFFLVCCSIFQR